MRRRPTIQQPDYTVEQLNALREIANDELLYTECNLKIADKMGRLVPLRYNEQQLALWREVRRQEEAGLPVRIIILKARQIGFSTAVAGMFYYRATHRPLVKAEIVAHKADASTAIFNKMKMFQEESHPVLAPLVKASNAKEMLFENPSTDYMERRVKPGMRSSIRIETAMDPDAGRSKTIHLLHLSEMAFWPKTADATMNSLMNAVPPMPGTIVIIESTANGIGGRFYEEWQRAVQGQSPFVPLFFPWYGFTDYSMKPEDDFEATEEEKELIADYGVTDEQLAWRRWCILSNCSGNLDAFHQEYPSTPEEAFIATGCPVFDVKAIDKALRVAPDPIKVGRVLDVNEGGEHRAKFQTQARGYLKIWQPPVDGVEYVIGIDVALGVKDGDYSVMEVIRKDTREQVAEWHGHIDPDLLGTEAVFLGRYYNLALLAPEVNNHGIATVNAIRRYRYPRLYRRVKDGQVNDKTTSTYGWQTTQVTKPKIISMLTRGLRESATKIKSRAALSECLTYVVEEDGRKTSAQIGCHDDRVMALAIAYYVLDYRDYAEEVPQFREIKAAELYHANATTGY